MALSQIKADSIASNAVTTATLSDSGVTAGSYGNTTAIPVITVDAKGRITSATTNSVSGVTGLSFTSANNTLTVSTSTVAYTANIQAGLDQAYSNATSTAATDASTKAATAYTNAASYADTKAATAYSNATSYANTKAATAYSNATGYADTNFTKLTETRAVSISNTLASGNTTVTGFANVTGSLLVGGVATITGNLVVNGTTITVNTSQINTTDSLMYLASNNEVSDSIDIGFAGHYNNGTGANGHTGLIRSAVTKKYYLFQNYQPELLANNTVDVANTGTGIQMADLVVGNLVANSTLTVTGAATFSNTTAHTGAATFSNTIAVTGTSTFTGLITGTITSANNADYLDGQHGAYYAANSQLASYALLSGATFSGAVSGITTLAAGNTSVNGTISVYRATGTDGSNTGSTLLTLTNYVGADLNQQKSYVDFAFLDDNSKEYPQVRIGAEVGQDNNADNQTKEGSGAFVVYTNYATTDGSANSSPTGMAERLRVDYAGNVGIANAVPTHKLSVNGPAYFSNTVIFASNYADGSTPARAATSAAAIKTLTGTTMNGAYWIKASANAPAQQVYCIMDTSIDSTGGWMIITHNDARNTVYNQAIQPRPTAYTSYTGTTARDYTSYNPWGIWNLNARDMSFTNMVVCVYPQGTYFTNVVAYAWGSWSTSQVIPTESATWSLTPTTTGQVLGNLGNKRIWGNSGSQYNFYNFAVQNATNGSGAAYYPYFGWFYSGISASTMSMNGEGTTNSSNPNIYGLDDWQDGNGLGDAWGVEGQGQNAYRGYPSYVMIR